MRGLVSTIVDRVTKEPRWMQANRVPFVSQTLAGVQITPDNAITIATVWACLRYLSQTVAVLPWHVMKDGPKGPEIQKSNPVDWLLWKRPSPEWSSFQLRETLTHWALRYGNGYAEIEPDQGNRPFALWPIHPERVAVCRAVDDGVDNYGDTIRAGDLFYEINNDNGAGEKTKLSARRMFHVRGFGEGPVGINVIQYAAQSLGWARAAQLFGATFFGNGLNPAGVVSFKKPLKPGGLQKQREEFDALYRGPGRAHRTAFIDNEATWTQLSFSARESQLIDVHQHLVEEICRWFGVPPHKVMHLLRATFSNIEHQAIEVVVDSVSPWVKRFEDEADYKLFGQNRQGLYTKMNMKALLRGDSAAQADFFRAMFDMGVYSPNRILEALDENTIGPDGDKRLVQLNLTTLEHAGEEPEPPPPPPDNDDDDDQQPDDSEANTAVDTITRILEPA